MLFLSIVEMAKDDKKSVNRMEIDEGRLSIGG